ncbi:MAG: lipid-A-disaccharide synthase [Candidatus Omnitrophota bacterium]
MNTTKNILIIAGEASSDMHAANLINDLKSLDNNIKFWGLGGDNMKKAGVKLLYNIVHLAFIGPAGLFKHYLKLKKIFNSLCSQISSDPPDAAILIDYAEFNLRVAKHLHSLGVPIIYYISPQIWAWGLWRIKTIKKLVNKMLVFFKFEEELYKSHGVDVSFVGHPLLETVKVTSEKKDIMERLGLSHDKKRIGIVPGSRKSEIKTMLPIMLASAKLISKQLGKQSIDFILPLAHTIKEDSVKKIIQKNGMDIKIVKNDTHNAISVCDCAIVTSGTATLETALLGVPMAIIYKSNFLTYILTKNLIKLPYIGLVNVVAGKRIASEFLQYEARPHRIAEYILRLISDKKMNSSMKEEFIKIKNSLGEPGAGKRAANEVITFLNSKTKK